MNIAFVDLKGAVPYKPRQFIERQRDFRRSSRSAGGFDMAKCQAFALGITETEKTS